MTAFAATLFAGAAALPATAWAQDHAHHAEQDKKEEKAGEQERPAPTPSDAPVLPGLQFGPDGQLTVGEADTVIPLDETPPPAAFEGPRHAADEIYGEAAMAPARAQLAEQASALARAIGVCELELVLDQAATPGLVSHDAKVGQLDPTVLAELRGYQRLE